MSQQPWIQILPIQLFITNFSASFFTPLTAESPAERF